MSTRMTDIPIYDKKAWTFLIFMAGDNDLESFAHLDLVELESLPSDENLHVLVQFDSRADLTYRFRFFPGGRELIGEPLLETNTGDPNTLTEFVTWGKKHFPAEQSALIIWNHGTGLRDLPANFNYSALRSNETTAIQSELQRTLFSSTLTELSKTQRRLRGVAIDATNRDYLDNQELQKALFDVPGDGPRVNIIGFDACLMNAVEISYQLRGLAQFMIGSQETEPGVGWPYQEILTALAKQPTVSAKQLANLIVDYYAQTSGNRLRGRESPYTQSVLSLDQVHQTFELIKNLSIALNNPSVLNHTKVKSALRRAREQVKRFRDRDLVDLLDWCELMHRETKGSAGDGFREPLLALKSHLLPGEGLILKTHAHGGTDANRIHGASIYWPQNAYLQTYDMLDFAASGWGELVKGALAFQ